MILSIDFGGAVAKVLIIKGDKFSVVEVPLGFRTRPRLTITEALRYIIKQALPAGRQAETLYVSGEVASTELKEILTKPALDPVEALARLGLPIVVVGAGITYVNGRARRGDNLALKPEAIARWLPFKIKLSEVQNFFANKEIYPQVVPATKREIKLEQAAARARIKTLVTESASGGKHSFGSAQDGQAPEEDYIIASGGVLSKAPKPSHVVLMLLDSLQPKGLLKVYLDAKQILPALAALTAYEEARAQKIWDQNPFTFLGTTFSFSEPVALKIDVGLEQMQELELGLGDLVVFPLDIGKKATVHFETKREKGEFRADGSLCGLIIDARGRPLVFPKGASERQRVLAEWEEAVCFAPLSKK